MGCGGDGNPRRRKRQTSQELECLGTCPSGSLNQFLYLYFDAEMDGNAKEFN